MHQEVHKLSLSGDSGLLNTHTAYWGRSFVHRVRVTDNEGGATSTWIYFTYLSTGGYNIVIVNMSQYLMHRYILEKQPVYNPHETAFG